MATATTVAAGLPSGVGPVHVRQRLLWLVEPPPKAAKRLEAFAPVPATIPGRPDAAAMPFAGCAAA